MIGHVFKVIDSPTAIRYFLVAIDDVNVATQEVRKKVGNQVAIDSRPLTNGVCDYLGISDGQIHQWGPT
jgi:hypothetical protein